MVMYFSLIFFFLKRQTERQIDRESERQTGRETGRIAGYFGPEAYNHIYTTGQKF